MSIYSLPSRNTQTHCGSSERRRCHSSRACSADRRSPQCGAGTWGRRPFARRRSLCRACRCCRCTGTACSARRAPAGSRSNPGRIRHTWHLSTESYYIFIIYRHEEQHVRIEQNNCAGRKFLMRVFGVVEYLCSQGCTHTPAGQSECNSCRKSGVHCAARRGTCRGDSGLLSPARGHRGNRPDTCKWTKTKDGEITGGKYYVLKVLHKRMQTNKQTY